MPDDASGNYTRPSSPIPVSGQDADAPQVNVPINDIASALTRRAMRDGRSPLLGNWNVNGYRMTNAADAINQQDYVTLAQMQALISGLSQVPVGSMFHMSGTSAPAGYVIANGQSLSRTGNAALWAFAQASGNLAGTDEDKTAGQYGPGDGSTTFTVPNLEADGGYFIRPVSSGRGIGTVQDDANKSHNHEIIVDPAGAHSHSFSLPLAGSIGGGGGLLAAPPVSSFTGGTDVAADHVHGATIYYDGGLESRPKNIAYPVVIKA